MPRILIFVTVVIFGFIFGAALFNKKEKSQENSSRATEVVVGDSETPIEIIVKPTPTPTPPPPPEPKKVEPVKVETKETPRVEKNISVDPIKSLDGLPAADRIDELFSTSGPKLPFIKTITYQSRVAWLRGRPAWIVDYASHYKTSRHFIARSLHGKRDYEKQDVSNGDRFNIFDPDVDLSFHLVVDLSRSKMWLYAVDKTHRENTLLKVYDVGLGRQDPSSPSGLLTPLGTYTLGNNIAVYKPNSNDIHKGKKIEMIRVFGTRWIPFGSEVKDTTAPAKGFGIHGVPWVADNSSEQLHEDISSLGKYESDGCIRLAKEDIEEIYAIIVTKPATIQMVSGFSETSLPWREVR